MFALGSMTLPVFESSIGYSIFYLHNLIFMGESHLDKNPGGYSLPFYGGSMSVIYF